MPVSPVTRRADSHAALQSTWAGVSRVRLCSRATGCVVASTMLLVACSPAATASARTVVNVTDRALLHSSPNGPLLIRGRGTTFASGGVGDTAQGSVARDLNCLPATVLSPGSARAPDGHCPRPACSSASTCPIGASG
jgi:hypothetical protein